MDRRFDHDNEYENDDVYDDEWDEDHEEEMSSLSDLPETERQVRIESMNWTLFQLHRRYLKGEIMLLPFAQKAKKWSLAKRSKLIESALRFIPIPSIYLLEGKDGKLKVVDGQERLRAFFDYMDENYALYDLPVLKELNQHTFKKLPTKYQRKIQEYPLHLSVIRKETHPDIVFDIVQRINEGAISRSAQDIRTGMYPQERIEFLRRLAQDEYFRKMTHRKLGSVHLKDQEVVLRFLSFFAKRWSIECSGTLNRAAFLNETLENFEQYFLDTEVIEELFRSTMRAIYEVFGETAFLKNPTRKKINFSLYDILTFSFATFDQSALIANKEAIKSALYKLMEEDPEFRRSITVNTLSGKSIEYRLKYLACRYRCCD